MDNTAIQKTEKQQNRVEVPERLDQAPYFTPLVDIIETADAYILQADMPGVKAGDVDISYENGVLTLLGKAHPRQQSNQSYVWSEYGIGHFYRQFTIGADIQVDGIRAELKSGVLEVFVPKAETAKTRKIQIQTS